MIDVPHHRNHRCEARHGRTIVSADCGDSVRKGLGIVELGALGDVSHFFYQNDGCVLIQYLIDGNHRSQLHQHFNDLGCLHRHLLRECRNRDGFRDRSIVHDRIGRQREGGDCAVVPSDLPRACHRSFRACQPATPSTPRVLIPRRFALSSRQLSLTCFFAVFLSVVSGLFVGSCNVPVPGATALDFLFRYCRLRPRLRPRLQAQTRPTSGAFASTGASMTGAATGCTGSFLFFCRSALTAASAAWRDISSACFLASSSRIAVCSASIANGAGSAGASTTAGADGSLLTRTRFLRTST